MRSILPGVRPMPTRCGRARPARQGEQDLQGALEIESKLKQTVPLYREQDEAFQKLVKDGYVPN